MLHKNVPHLQCLVLHKLFLFKIFHTKTFIKLWNFLPLQLLTSFSLISATVSHTYSSMNSTFASFSHVWVWYFQYTQSQWSNFIWAVGFYDNQYILWLHSIPLQSQQNTTVVLYTFLWIANFTHITHASLRVCI